jgi:WD40 repeat protein
VTGEFALPTPAGGLRPPEWGYINVVGEYLIGGADPLRVDPKDVELPKQLHVWDTASRKLKLTLEGHLDEVNAVAYSPDGSRIASGGDDGLVILWDVHKGRLAAVLKGHTEEVNCVAFSPDGKLVAGGGRDKLVMLWDAASGRHLATLTGHTENVACLAFSPDGKTLASGSESGAVKLWDPVEHREKGRLDGHTGPVTGVAFSRDGKLMATSSRDGTARVWDAAAGESRLTLEGHKDDVLCAAFSSDGALVITGSRDKTVAVWDAATGKRRFTLDGHAGAVTSVSASSDGKTLAAATDQAEVKLWDLGTRKSPGSVKGKAGSYLATAFAPDGKTFAAGGRETAAKAAQDNMSSSRRLVVMDRHTGRVLWSIDARSGFRHNAVCVGGGRLYCIDRLSGGQVDRLKRRGLKAPNGPRLAAYELTTGLPLWSTQEGVFGTWLSYSETRDVLVEAGRGTRDTIKDEPKGMRAFRAADGKVLWNNTSAVGPAMIHGDTVLREGGAVDLLTGKPRMRIDPITGKPVEWTWTRTYGCNTPQAAVHLMTFRSGAAGYYDLACDGGTGNFGGFRSGCTNNLIVAGGVLAAADYTRTCTCSYQNQTSIGLVHMPEVETWTQFPVAKGIKPSIAAPPSRPGEWVEWFFAEMWPPRTPVPLGVDLKHLALNLGAPGDRRADDGRVWLNEYVNAEVTHDPAMGRFNLYSARVRAVDKQALPWVAASGVRGIQRLEIDPRLDPARRNGAAFTVRLHFADPDNDAAGRRVFDVRLQGGGVLSDFDIVKEAGGRYAAIVRVFRGVSVKDKLIVEFAGRAGADASAAPLLCGIEIVRED